MIIIVLSRVGCLKARAGQPECTARPKQARRTALRAGGKQLPLPANARPAGLSEHPGFEVLIRPAGLAKISSHTSLVSLVNRKELQMPAGASKQINPAAHPRHKGH